jgi:hypothetical protein
VGGLWAEVEGGGEGGREGGGEGGGGEGGGGGTEEAPNANVLQASGGVGTWFWGMVVAV